MLKRLTLFLSLFFCFGLCYGAPRVVVTIKPLHGLVSAIMQNVAKPTLLLPDDSSPHTFSLKPSNLQALQQADLIMWVGPSLEGFMQRPLASLHPQYGVITFLEIPNLHLLEQRSGRQWAHSHDHDEHENEEQEHNHDSHNHGKGSIDPHFWLSTDNALIVIDYISQYLANLDHENASHYQANAQTLKNSIMQLKSMINQKLASVHDKPFMVYHDGYQYFEKEFNLDAVGTFMLNPHLPLSAKSLLEVKTLIKDQKVRCVFRETEFNDSKMEELLKDAGVTFRELDPLGARIQAGIYAYQEIMLGIAKTMQSCLES